MTTLAGTLVVCQALGALIGTICAVWGQVSHTHALRDGLIDKAERAHLDALAHGLWVGMTLMLAASLGLVIIAYKTGAAVQPAMTASYWVFMALALLVITLTWALSRGLVSSPLAPAAILMAWWTLLYLTLGRFPNLSFGASVAAYVVGTGLLYLVLHYVRVLASHTIEPDTTWVPLTNDGPGKEIR